MNDVALLCCLTDSHIAPDVSVSVNMMGMSYEFTHPARISALLCCKANVIPLIADNWYSFDLQHANSRVTVSPLDIVLNNSLAFGCKLILCLRKTYESYVSSFFRIGALSEHHLLFAHSTCVSFMCVPLSLRCGKCMC